MECRDSTLRHHKERLNKVLIYIQEHIDSPLSLQTLADIACFSSFHFHRIFQAYIGETLYDYVRRNRLEKAAQKLRFTTESVTSIALAVGYDTPAAFTKAFRQYFGKSPSLFKKAGENAALVMPKLSTRHESSKMKLPKPEIRNMQDQKVVFVRRTGTYAKAAAEAWPAIMNFAYSHDLINKETLCIGISHDNPDITEKDKLRYDACVTITGDIKPEGEVGTQIVHGGRYSVFLHKGSYEKLGDTYNAIFSQWLPTSNEKLRDLPCFDVYVNDPARTKPKNLTTEIWIPIF